MENDHDQFRVPSNMFGPVPEAFFGAVGRVVLIAALNENKLASVLMQLEQVSEGEHAGMSPARLVKRLDELTATRELPQRLLDLRAEIVATSDERNAIVHSLWPSPTMERAWGWRGVTGRSGPGDNPIAEVHHNEHTLQALISRLVAVHTALHSLASSGELTRPPMN